MIVSEGFAYPKSPIRVDGEVVLDQGYPVVWFIFLGEWHDIGKVYLPRGGLKGYYCDIVRPVQLVGRNTLRIVDLFLDLWVSPRLKTTVLDEEEFNGAVQRGWIDAETAITANDRLNKLINTVHRGLFPPRFVTEFGKWR
ncbi:MAG: DUF402 domain-containing protein [Candidatus Bathyarchaeia archaeon]